MEELQLNAQIRNITGTGNANRLRRQGFVPAVFYGKEIASKGIMVKSKELEKFIKKHGENAIVQLVVDEDGTEKTYTTLIREVQRHPLKEEFTHIDFNQISMQDELDTTVAVYLVGEAQGVKDGGILQHGAKEIAIRCLATDIPENVEVNISELGIGDNLTVKSLDLGEKIEILTDKDTLVATVLVPALGAETEEEAEEEEITEEEE